jgi:Putative Tad-like Flp pilus-assembly/Putative Flp pilus-assembly TadE/G-like
MTQHRRVRRVARRRSHGQSVVIMALGAIALIATVGLAIDGGAEVGNYRDAQNAADAGALAAARLIFLGGIASPPSAPTTTQLTTASNSAITENGAVPGKSDLSAQLTTSGGTQNNFVPDSGTGVTAHSALATITAGLNAGLASVSATVAATEASASSLVRTIASGGAVGTGQVDLASVNATVTALGIPLSATGALLCLQSSLTYPTALSSNLLGSWANAVTCPLNSLSAVTSLLGALGSITASAGVNLSPESTSTFISNVSPYLTRTISSNATTTANILNLGTSVTASAANVVSQVGQSANVIASNDFNLVNVATGLLSLGVSIPLVTIHNELDYSPSGGVTAPTPTCDTGSITIAGSTYSILPNCHIPILPITLLGVTLSDITTDVTTSGCPGLTCTEHGCFLQLSVLGSLANVCVGEFDLSASGDRMSTSAAAGDTPLTNAVTVTAHKPTPTYFTHVLGWNGTNPTAQTTAGVYQVANESDAAFANAPYAVPSVATNMDCPCSAAPLSVGHDYYLDGSQMQTYSPVDKFASTWQGQVSAPSGHAVGNVLSSVTGAGSGPGTYTSGGGYYLLPVIDPSSAVVEYYAVFKPVAGQPNWGQLVDNIPVQATPSTAWTNTTPAAAETIRVSG